MGAELYVLATFHMASMYSNTGLDFFGSAYGVNVPTFYDIQKVNEVYQLVNDVKNSSF
jgi:hypothetical protein